MNYRYKETVDWGIIKREWIHEEPEYTIILEKHEEDRFTVKITHKQRDLEYYSYWKASGKLTFGSLDEAQVFAADRLAKMKSGDFQFCTGQSSEAEWGNTRQ
jgi:formate-dependent phosphoribosylglycinamide formyltransferase (GAR transformylase)